MAPISSKKIELSGAPSRGQGQGAMQNSSTNFSAVCFNINMILELGGDFVLLINLDRNHCSRHVSMSTNNLKSRETCLKYA